MNPIVLMFRKEWMNFIQGDRSVFFVYLFLVAGWGVLLATLDTPGSMSAPLWIVFFSVIVGVNFSSTVFVLERMSGSLEVLITSGIPRSAILYGKMLFVIVMTVVIGAVCAAFALLLMRLFPGAEKAPAVFPAWHYCALYVSAAFLHAAGSACFSVWLPNPRLLHFINLLIAGFVMTAYTTASFFHSVPLHLATALLGLLGAIFTVCAKKEFESERIVRPVLP